MAGTRAGRAWTSSGVAKNVLASHGWLPEVEDVLEVQVSDRPGALGAISKRLGEAGVNINFVFIGPGGRREAVAFLGVSDIRAAVKALR